jgi:proteic killer suppression protein
VYDYNVRAGSAQLTSSREFSMDFRFGSDELQRVWNDEAATLNQGPAVDKKFRDRVRVVKNAKDERDLRALKSLRYEQLKGKRKHQSSIRLNDQWRLIVQWEKLETGSRLILISVEDYH